MAEDWKANHPRRGNEGAPVGENLSDWYRRKIDEMTTHEQFVDLWDKQRERRQQPPVQTQAAPAPWQGITEIAQAMGINLGDLWHTREEELKASKDAADTTNKELHELRLREIDRRVQELQAMAEKVDQKTSQSQVSQGQKSFLEKLDDLTQGMVSKRIAGMFGGNNNQSQPKDPVDEFFNRLEQVEKVKERFGNPGGGGVQALAQSGMRGEILKLLMEDERERLKIQQYHEAEMQKIKHLGKIAGAVEDNLGTGIEALKAAAGEFMAGTGTKTPDPAPEQKQVFACGDCQAQFSPPAGWAGQPLKCPSCGREYSKEELSG